MAECKADGGSQFAGTLLRPILDHGQGMLMRQFTFIALTALWMLSAGTAVAAAPEASRAVEARAAQVSARLSPKARAWLKQEAAKLRAANNVSDASARQAIRSAGPALDLGSMSVEDAMVVMMMDIAQDAREDLRQMTADMDRTRLQRKTAREANAATHATANTATQPAQSQAKALRAPSVVEPKAGVDSMSGVSQEQQLRMQMAMDQVTKAEAVASSAMKKTSDAASAVTSNMK